MGLFLRRRSNPVRAPLIILSVICLTSLIITQSSAEDDGNLTAYEVLKTYDFPVGILPVGVTGYELDKSTGKFAVYLEGSCSFKISGYNLKYKSTITGYISKGKLTKLKGVSVKILLLWVNIVEVIRSEDELEFSVGIASADFPTDNFEESPQCGCGFDCVNQQQVSRIIETNPLVSSS